MSAPILEAYKKRKTTSKFFDFRTFADPGCPIFLTGPFHENIVLFLQECVDAEGYGAEGISSWSTVLIHENKGFAVPKYAVEDTVENSGHPFCDHCRCAG